MLTVCPEYFHKCSLNVCYALRLGEALHLIIVDELLQFICMDHDVKATHLGQPELFPIHTGEAHLTDRNRIILNPSTLSANEQDW